MHIMNKKELSSEELWTVKRSRIPTVVLTANGEVHTNEEAQVFVHDLNLFVVVQLLDETPAVLSLGKLCDDHGYSYEWISGQEPHLIKNGIRIECNTENFVPIVVPGLSTSSSSSLSSSTSMTRSRREIDHPTSSSSSSTPKMGRPSSAKRTFSYLFLFQGNPPILEAVRPLHLHHQEYFGVLH